MPTEKLYSDPTQFEYDKLIKPEHASTSCLEPTPDNSLLQVNVFVKNLDKSWTVADLYELFREYGDIRSCKISRNPKTHESNGYGYVWFEQEDAARKAVEQSKQGMTPLIIEAYRPRTREENGLERVVENMDTTIVVSNFDESETREEDLILHFRKFGVVTSCKILTLPSFSLGAHQQSPLNAALISFQTPQMSDLALYHSYDTPFHGQCLFAEPAKDSMVISKILGRKDDTNDDEDMELKISNIPNSLKKESILEELSKYGQLDCVSFVSKPRVYTSEATFKYRELSSAQHLLHLKYLTVSSTRLLIKRAAFTPVHVLSAHPLSTVEGNQLVKERTYAHNDEVAVGGDMKKKRMMIKEEDVDKEMGRVYGEYRQAFQGMDKAKCCEKVYEYVRLMEKRNGQDAAEDMGKKVKARMDQVSSRKMGEWLRSFSTFSLFMDE